MYVIKYICIFLELKHETERANFDVSRLMTDKTNELPFYIYEFSDTKLKITKCCIYAIK